MYWVEFAGGKVTGLPNTVITELIYSLCDADGNEYLLIDELVDYHKDNKAISKQNNRPVFEAYQ